MYVSLLEFLFGIFIVKEALLVVGIVCENFVCKLLDKNFLYTFDKLGMEESLQSFIFAKN